jgi:putative hydrolase of the HAD superfamily
MLHKINPIGKNVNKVSDAGDCCEKKRIVYGKIFLYDVADRVEEVAGDETVFGERRASRSGRAASRFLEFDVHDRVGGLFSLPVVWHPFADASIFGTGDAVSSCSRVWLFPDVVALCHELRQSAIPPEKAVQPAGQLHRDRAQFAFSHRHPNGSRITPPGELRRDRLDACIFYFSSVSDSHAAVGAVCVLVNRSEGGECQMIQACLFDLDGTLLDRDQSILRFAYAQYERFSSRLRHIPRETYVRRFVELDQRGYVWKDKVYQTLREELQIRDASQEELLTDYLTRFHEHCIPFPHLQETLAALQKSGIGLALVTNGRGAFQQATIQALGIDAYFDLILISEWEGVSKPNPQIFQRACERLSVEASACVFVGDHPANDVAAARAAGMKAVWKRDLHVDPPAEADGVIDNLQELLQLLQQLLKTR